MLKIFSIFAALCGFFYSGLVFGAAGIGGFVQGVSATGQSVWFGPSTFQTKNAASVGSMVWAAGTNGGAVGSWSGQLPFGASKAAITFKGVATGAAVFNTFKTIAGGPVGIGLTAITLVPAVVDWMTAAKVRNSPSGSAKPFERVDPEICTSAPCYEYNTGFRPAVYGSKQTVCDIVKANYPDSTYWKYTHLVTGMQCQITETGPSNGANTTTMIANYTFGTRSISAVPVAWAPASIDDIRANMERTPSTSAAINALLDAGGSLPISYAPGSGAVPMAGPSSVTDPVVRTVANDGTNTTTTTATTKTDITYGTSPHPQTGVTVPSATGTSNTVTTVSVVNNTTNATTTSTSTTNNVAPVPAEVPEQKDPCETFPNRIGCLDVDTPEGEIERTTKTITYEAEDVFGSGSCPANLVSHISTLGQTVTVWDWEKTCSMAVPLRALVLALASFAAFLIVMPGETRT